MNKSKSTITTAVPQRTRELLRVVTIGIFILAGCRQSPPTNPTDSTSHSQEMPSKFEGFKEFIKKKGLSPEREKAALESVDEMRRQDDQSALDRQELIRPAKPGFSPANAKHKIQLVLTLEKSMIRRGENPRFRLELTNVGRETFHYSEIHGSFFKTGVISMSRDLQFNLKNPSGKEKLLITAAMGSGSPQEIFFPADWSEERKSHSVAEFNRRAKADSELSVDLLPGETLHTRGESRGDPFRSLISNGDYTQPGTYRIRVSFESDFVLKQIKPWMSAKQQAIVQKRRAAESMPPTHSNEVVFEVTQ